MYIIDERAIVIQYHTSNLSAKRVWTSYLSFVSVHHLQQTLFPGYLFTLTLLLDTLTSSKSFYCANKRNSHMVGL